MGELKTMMKCGWRVRFPQEAFQAERPDATFATKCLVTFSVPPPFELPERTRSQLFQSD
jgi:hypothetical protein